MNRERDYLQDMLEYTQRIADFTQDGRRVFFADTKTQFAVIRAYEVIGEIAKRLPDDLLQQQPEVAWKKVKGFRDFLAHNYEGVIVQIVWGTVEELPDLQKAIEALLLLDEDQDD